jgi:hypothetical protein
MSNGLQPLAQLFLLEHDRPEHNVQRARVMLKPSSSTGVPNGQWVSLSVRKGWKTAVEGGRPNVCSAPVIDVRLPQGAAWKQPFDQVLCFRTRTRSRTKPILYCLDIRRPNPSPRTVGSAATKYNQPR